MKTPNRTTNTQRINADPIHYHVAFSRYKQHVVDVTLTFTALANAPVLWMPSWIAGSYLMREFSRNITAVCYLVINDDEPNREQRANKLSKNEWQLIDAKVGQAIKVTYEVYSYDLSVRTAYIDQVRLYGNFTSLALAVSGLESGQVEITLAVPQCFYDDKPQVKMACGLKHTYFNTDKYHHYHLQADSYHDLIDYPFEIAAQKAFDFIIHDTHHKALVHRFYISGKHNTNSSRLQQDVTKICQTYVNWLGDAPFSDYTFMTYASGNDYGGLEHINSTSLVIPRSDLPTANEKDEPSESYQRYLGLCSHEYLHAWWVKTVRPDVMMDVDLRAEVYTPLLWVFEGFTSYIDDFMLQASGVVSKESYLKLLQAQINRYTQTQGRALQSVAESSFDAWIKLYRADENTGNAGISYYNKGALVAFCLDLTLMQHSEGKYRLFDVVKVFYEQAKQQSNKRIGMTNTNLTSVISQFMDTAIWQDFKARYVDGVEELPIYKLLEANGITISPDEKDNTLPWGIMVTESNEGLKVSKVLRDSVASEAGLSAKDVIVAIDGIKATKKQLAAVAVSELALVSCHAFRRDELMVFDVANKTASGIAANPSLDKVTLSLNESGFAAWLSPMFV